MGKVQKKKVTYVVGATLDGLIYCDHDVIETEDAHNYNTNQQEPKGARITQTKVPHSKGYNEKRTCGHSQKNVRVDHKKP